MDCPEFAPDDRSGEQFCSSDRAATSTSVGRISLLAVTAFLLSVAGVFVSAGLAAIVLGVVSLRRIRRSRNAVKGRLIALAAIALSLVMIPLPALILEMYGTRGITPEIRCRSNLFQLGEAMRTYIAKEHQLPIQSRWCDLLMSTGAVDPNVFRCPGTQEVGWRFVYPLEVYLYLRHKSANRPRALRCDYAMNQYAESVLASPDAVLLYDSKPGWNQTGGPDMLTVDNHAGKGCNVLFVDTHAEFIRAGDLSQLKWKARE